MNWYKKENYSFDENGKSPFEVFENIESRGKVIPCNDVDTLLKALDGKRRINLNIKMWVGGIIDGCTFEWELKEEFDYFPDWVWKSIQNQKWKRVDDNKKIQSI